MSAKRSFFMALSLLQKNKPTAEPVSNRFAI